MWVHHHHHHHLNTKNGMLLAHYHDFENLCQDADVSTDSPEFVCFGHKWCLQVYPGSRSGQWASDFGWVGLFLEHRSNITIRGIQYGFALRDKDRNAKAECNSFSHGGM